MSRRVVEQRVADDVETADGLDFVSDGEGVAVIGPQDAIEQYLRSIDLWAPSLALDLRPLKPLLGVAGDIAQAASEVAANSGRWIKLTDASARLVKEHGLMKSKTTPGQHHLMIGGPGIRSWLQTEQDFGALVVNPAALASIGGVMAQTALRQTMADIVDYLEAIDQKVDEVLAKVDNSVVAGMVGAGEVIESALVVRDETGGVNETLWSTVAQTHQTIATTQAYALMQLDGIAKKLETTKMGRLAEATALAEADVPKWLAVLARCFQLQDAVDVVELDRAFAESPEQVDAYCRGLKKTRGARRARIADNTASLLDRIDVAVGVANTRMVWNRTNCLEVVASANHLATGINDLHGLLDIAGSPRSWETRSLGPGARLGSHGIQVAKDKGPGVAAGAVAVAGLAIKTAGKSAP